MSNHAGSVLVALAVIAGTVALAKKPSKPPEPPEEPDGPAYYLETGLTSDGTLVGLNDRGLLSGGNDSWQACVVVPEDSDGDGAPDTWFRDDDNDGVNDLMHVLVPDARSHARDINDAGCVIGYVEPSGSRKWAFIIVPEDTDDDGVPDTWSCDDDADGANDLAINLGSLGGTVPITSVVALNDLGYVVGYAYWADGVNLAIQTAVIIVPEDTDGDGTPDRWFRDIDGDGANDLMVDLATLGGTGSRAIDVNELGDVLCAVDTGDGGQQAVLIVPEDTDDDCVPDTWFRDDDGDGANDLMIPLGDFTPAGMNDLGQVVGHRVNNRGKLAPVLCEVDLAQGAVTVTELPSIPKADATYACGINDAGRIVCTGVQWTGGSSGRNVVYIGAIVENGQAIRFLEEAVVNPEGIDHLEVLGINEADQIVGYAFGKVPGTVGGAFIALPVAPSQ